MFRFCRPASQYPQVWSWLLYGNNSGNAAKSLWLYLAAGKINESYITTNQLQNDNFSLMFKHVFNVPLIAVCFQQSWKMLQIQRWGVVSKLISLRAGLISAINVSMFQRRGGFCFPGWLPVYALNLKLCEYILYFLKASVTSYLNGDSISYHAVFLSYRSYTGVSWILLHKGCCR